MTELIITNIDYSKRIAEYTYGDIYGKIWFKRDLIMNVDRTISATVKRVDVIPEEFHEDLPTNKKGTVLYDRSPEEYMKCERGIAKS